MKTVENVGYDQHSIFSSNRTKELIKRLSKKETKIILAWGKNPVVEKLAIKALIRIPRNRSIFGLSDLNMKWAYRHPHPMLIDECINWLNKMEEQLKNEDAAIKNIWETIFSVGAKGGSITLEGFEYKTGKWLFRKRVNEIDDEGIINVAKRIEMENKKVTTNWQKALKLLDEYPWPLLYPLEVHPSFQNQVWQAFKERLENNYKENKKGIRISRWSEKCNVSSKTKIVGLHSDKSYMKRGDR